MSFVDVADDRHIRPSLGTSTSSSAEPPPKVISEEDFEDVWRTISSVCRY